MGSHHAWGSGRWHSPRGWRAITLICIALLGPGCTSITTQLSPRVANGIAPGDGLTVILYLYRDMPMDEMEAAEEKIAGCVEDAVRAAHRDVRVVPPEEFRRAAFPGLAFEEIPRSPEFLTQLVTNPTFQERIAPLGLRYVVIVTGGTEQKGGGMGICGAGGRGAGCLALIVFDRRSQLGAFILDVKQVRMANEFQLEAGGHPWLAIIGIFPIGLPAFTKHRACEEFGDTVVGALTSPPPAAPPPPK
jgi:hypothetical protein